MRLLAVGQSLIGIKGQGARYQMSEQNQLPKFNVGNQSSACRSNSAGKRCWLGRLKGIVVGWKGVSARNPQITQADKPLVQTTLALGRVRVVRNDLTESDLVVVPVKTRPPVGDPRRGESQSRGKGFRATLTQIAQRVADAARSLV